jgi:hypothetical protein
MTPAQRLKEVQRLRELHSRYFQEKNHGRRSQRLRRVARLIQSP